MKLAEARTPVVVSLVSLAALWTLARSYTWQPTTWRPFSASDGDLLQDVLNSTLGFQKIFILNLESRTDRRDAMSLAAAVSGLHFEYLPGVRFEETSRKTLPPSRPSAETMELSPAQIGCWRAHMNALRQWDTFVYFVDMIQICHSVVENNLASALIIEDDVDWDFRIKSQLQQYAQASRLLVQPTKKGAHLDQSWPKSQPGQTITELTIEQHSHLIIPPHESPYGDLQNWDLLYLGSTGNRIPSDPSRGVPLGRVVMHDPTAVDPADYDQEWGDATIHEYPPNTRLVARSIDDIGATAYAVSQSGARRLLYEIGIRELYAPVDNMYRFWCSGLFSGQPRSCLTAQPPFFHVHFPRGSMSGMSDIGEFPDIEVSTASTKNIRQSVRLNLDRLADGRQDLEDQFPDF